MEPLSALPLLLWVTFSSCCAFQDITLNPRIIQQHPVVKSVPLSPEEKNAVFYLSVNSSLYIGGQAALYQLDFHTTYPLLSPIYICNISVTFMGQLNGKLMVCGTRDSNPSCCKMDGENLEEVPRSLVEQLSPRFPGANYNILITGDDVYSTIPRRSNNAGITRAAIFRKVYGKEPYLYTSSSFMRNPLFVKSLAVEREERVQNKIYLFFMEDSTETRTTQRRVPMIAQMCKEENGSEKPDSRNMFSTALKTRLICGNQEAGQYYPFLQDIYFLEAQDVVYGLFLNAWNHSAICSYKIKDIELVFNTSELFGSTKRNLIIRPGTCLPKPKRTPQETSDEANAHPELTSWIWPLSNQTVFQTLHHYRKLVVDEVTALDKKTYRVLILATDKGSLHKVVEFDDGATNILEMSPFGQEGKILYLALDPNKRDHVLYVGSANEVSQLALDDCSAYTNTCANCFLARDPYCGWSEGKCQSILTNAKSKAMQNLTAGAMCYEKVPRVLLPRGASGTDSRGNKAMPPSTYYVTCPAESNQAKYWWTNGGKFMENCTPQNGTCILLVEQVTYPGVYRCMAMERSVEREVLKYTFDMQNNSERTQCSWLVVLSASLYLVYLTL